MKGIELSIIIPVYNGEKYIRQTLDSLLKNNLYNVEIIVVNDGSTDSTEDICSSYDIKLFNIKNHGVSYARNYGLKQATGKFIMFVDADDYLCDDWYEIIKKYFSPNYDIVYFNKDLNVKSSKTDLIENILNIKEPLLAGPVCKLLKRKLIVNNDITFPKDVISGEDMIFNLKYLSYVKNFKIDNNSFYMYRIYTGSSTKTFNEKAFKSALRFNEEVTEILYNMKFLKSSDRNRIIKLSCNDTITFISNRIAYVKPYKVAKEMYKRFDLPEYRNIINKEYKVKNQRRIKKIVLFLCKIRMYFLVYFLYRFRIILRSNKKEEVRKI